MTRLRHKAAVHEALASVAAQVGIGTVERLTVFVIFKGSKRLSFEYGPGRKTAAVKAKAKKGDA